MTDQGSFYGRPGLNVETYDAFQERYANESGFPALDGDVEFYKSLAVSSGGPVLELACGTGRVAWPIAEAGVDVVGLDLSEAMLGAARAKGERYPADVRARATFVSGNMAEFDLGRVFPLVVIAFRSFQSLLTVEEERACLERIRRHLAPEGRLVIDNFDPLLQYCLPEAESPVIDRSATHPVTGNAVKIEVVERTTDPYRQLITEHWRFTEHDENGDVVREEEDVLKLRWIYRQEMRYLFELTGFRVEGEFSDFHGDEPGYGKEQIWIARGVR
ncbi:MAG: class I SAM-dependent methyltransferase [Candidatus Eisenbacteria bacterium]